MSNWKKIKRNPEMKGSRVTFNFFHSLSFLNLGTTFRYNLYVTALIKVGKLSHLKKTIATA